MGLIQWGELDAAADITNGATIDQPGSRSQAAVDRRVKEGGRKRTIYVHPGGDDAADGRSWATPKKTIAAALAAIPAGVGTVELSEGQTYVITETLNLTYQRHRLVGGQRTRIDASAIRNAPAIRLSAVKDGNYVWAMTPIESIELVGPGRGNLASVGIAIGAAPVTDALAQFVLRDLNVHGFGAPYKITDGTFALTMINCQGWEGDRALWVDSTSNAAAVFERLTFLSCDFFNSGYGVYTDAALSGLHLTACSLDYCDTLVYANRTSVYLTDCHFEAGAAQLSNSAVARTTPFIQMGASSETFVSVRGGKIHLDNSKGINPVVVPAFIQNGGGNALVQGVHISEWQTQSRTMATGPGVTNFRDCYFTPGRGAAPCIAQAARSLAPSTAFKSIDFVDQWYVTNCSGYDPNWRLTGTEVNCTYSDADAHTSGKSFRIEKLGSDRTKGAVQLYIPVEAGRMITWSLWARLVGAGTGKASLRAGFITNLQMKPNPVYTNVVTAIANVDIPKSTSNPTNWQWWTNGGDAYRVPSGATHLAIEVFVADLVDVRTLIDDINVSQW